MKNLRLAALALLALIGCASPQAPTSTSLDVTAVAIRDSAPPHWILVQATVDGTTFPRLALSEDRTATAFVGESDEDGETGQQLEICCEHDHVHLELIEKHAGQADRTLWRGNIPITEIE